MKTSIYAYLEKPSMVDFPKHFAAVFFTSGCNFRCGFCHNAALIGKKQAGLSRERLEAACQKFKNDWVNGVVITGGEPTCCGDLVELIRLFKEKFGFAVKLDTNGSNPDQLAECLPLVDYVAMDVKAGLSGYEELVHYSNLENIRRSIERIKSGAKDYEFRTTVIEPFHTNEQMDEVRELISGARRYALQAFIPRDGLPDPAFSAIPRTTSARLKQLRDRMAGCSEEIHLRGA